MSVDLTVLKKELEELEQGFSENQTELKSKEQNFKNEELAYYKSVSESFKLLQVLSTKQVHFLATHLNLRTKQYEALRKSVDAKKPTQKLPSLPENKTLGRKNNVKPDDAGDAKELVELIKPAESVNSKELDTHTDMSGIVGDTAESSTEKPRAQTASSESF